MARNGLRVFLVGGEAAARTGLRRLLDRLGHVAVGEAACGARAAKEAQRRQAELLLVDAGGTVSEGIGLLSQLSGTGIACVAVAERFPAALMEAASAAGALGCLVRPFGEEQLAAALGLAALRAEELALLRSETRRLRTALEERKSIERAKGILMDRFGLHEQEAMRRLQQKSRGQNKKLAAVAREIILADERPEALIADKIRLQYRR